jgi:hypothetical protein
VAPDTTIRVNGRRAKCGVFVQRRLSLRKKIAFSVIFSLALYGIAEAVLTATMPIAIGDIGGDTFWLVERGGCFKFDPIRGYAVSRKPLRFTRVTKSEIEYVGRFQGNAQGFQGDKDFTLKKPPGVQWRSMVFGDSFSSAAFLKTPWPKRALEKLPDWELYNFSIDGAGLANWWSVLTRLVLTDGYEFDQVIFASIPNDLNRPFVIGTQNEGAIVLGYVGWNPDCFPRDYEEAAKRLNRPTFYSASRIELESSIRERRRCWGTNPHHQTRPWIASHVSQIFNDLIKHDPEEVFEELALTGSPPASTSLPQVKATRLFSREQMAMICDMRNRLAARHIPVVVIHIPGRDELLKHRDDSEIVRAFASLLGANFVDGSGSFRSLNADEVRAHYLPYDGHWNQAGSDRFADSVALRLRDLVPSIRHPHAIGATNADLRQHLKRAEPNLSIPGARKLGASLRRPVVPTVRPVG